MKIIEAAPELERMEKGCVLTIGNFDGVHAGHRQILTAAGQAAARRATELLVLTFEPHPLAVLYPDEAPDILTPLALKKYLLAELGADCLFVLQSTTELLGLSAEDFIQRFLIEGIQPAVVVEGESFNFGSGRSGSISTLQELGAERNFEVSVVQSKEVELSAGRKIKASSSTIRDLLTGGDVADAAIALGRGYRLMEKIVTGQGKGRQLGFPTVNMKPPRQLIPAEGVYAGFVEIGDSCEQVCRTKERIPAVFSIGRSETLGGDNPLAIEAHILADNFGQMTGKWLAMDFAERLRGQQKFEKEKNLTVQIADDCERAKEILAIQRRDCSDK